MSEQLSLSDEIQRAPTVGKLHPTGHHDSYGLWGRLTLFEYHIAGLERLRLAAVGNLADGCLIESHEWFVSNEKVRDLIHQFVAILRPRFARAVRVTFETNDDRLIRRST